MKLRQAGHVTSRTRQLRTPVIGSGHPPNLGTASGEQIRTAVAIHAMTDSELPVKLMIHSRTTAR